MTDAAGLDLHQHFAGLRSLEIQGYDLQGLARGIGNCGFGFHIDELSDSVRPWAPDAARSLRAPAWRVQRGNLYAWAAAAVKSCAAAIAGTQCSISEHCPA